MARLNLQLHHNNQWHQAASIEIENTTHGIGSATSLDYDMNYVAAWDAAGLKLGKPAFDNRALSVRYPTDFAVHQSTAWPPFLLDVLPQGPARRRFAEELGFKRPEDPEVEFPLLLRGGSCPIGNLRIEEAWKEEAERLTGGKFKGLETADILEQTDRFGDAIDRFMMIASGSSGVQGDWPKALLTQAKDGLWYPDPLVEDGKAALHTIVKLLRDRDKEYAAILAAEAPYLEVARAFGLRVGKPMRHQGGVLIIPRFDREPTQIGVIRHGQESLVSALGIAQFGHVGHHERYIEVLCKVSSNPREEIIEYILRDLLNLAMGNTDNHGRNTALQKRVDGRIQLTPLYDFTPMRLDPTTVVRSTRWQCLNGGDTDPDWDLVSETVANEFVTGSELRTALKAKANFLRSIPDIAREKGVAEDTINLACSMHEQAAKSVERLKD